MRVIGLYFKGIQDPENENSPFCVVAARDKDSFDLFIEEFKKLEGEEANAYPVLEAESISPVSSRIDLFRSAHTTGSYTYRLSATNEVGEALFGRATRGVAFLDNDLTSDGETNIFLNREDLNPGVYFVGGETIRLGPHTSEGVYPVERGLFRTDVQQHEEGANVFDLTPWWLGRTIEIFEWTPDGGFKTLDTQRITSSFEQIGPYMEVTTESAIVGAEESVVNTNPADIVDDVRRVEFSSSDREFYIVFDRPNIADYRLYKRATDLRNFETEDYIPAIPIKVGEKYSFIVDDDSPRLSTANFYNLSSQRIFSEPEDTVVDLLNGNIEVKVPFAIWPEGINYEVEEGLKDFVEKDDVFQGQPAQKQPSSPTNLYQELQGETLPVREGFTSEITITQSDAKAYIKHPLAVTLPFLIGTSNRGFDPFNFDVYDVNWVLNVRDAFDVSEEGINRLHRLILDTTELQIDHLFIDGESENLWDIIRGIWSTYGFTLATTPEGLYTVDRIDLPDFVDAAGGRIFPMEPDENLTLSDGEVDKARKIEANLENVPWRDSTSLQVSSFEEIDGQPPSVATLTDELRITNQTERSPSKLRNLLVNRLLIQDFNMPQLRFRVDRKKQDLPGIGEFIRLEDVPLKAEWMWSFERNVRTNEADTEFGWVLKVIEKEYDPASDSYILNTLLLSESLVRFRAPSLFIQGVNDYQDGFVRLLVSNEFGLPLNDAEYFTPGDRVYLYDRYGELISDDDLVVTSVVSEIFIDLEFRNGIPESAFNAADILEIAAPSLAEDFVDSRYWNPGGNFVLLGELGVGRPYAYLADEDGVFEPFTSVLNTEGDLYG